MSFIRPELRAGFQKYAEVIVGGVITLIAVYILLTAGWLVQIGAAALGIMGAMIAILAWRRVRLRSDHIGPGVVEITEREISYLTAKDGAAVSIDALALVTIKRHREGLWGDDLFWTLEEDAGYRLSIPNSATGADRLFDALSALPGADFDAATRAMQTVADESFVIWSKPRRQLH